MIPSPFRSCTNLPSYYCSIHAASTSPVLLFLSLAAQLQDLRASAIMSNERRPQTPPSVAWDSTSGKAGSVHDDDDTPTDSLSPPSSSPNASPPKISKTPPSVPEPSNSQGTPPRRRGHPRFHLSLLDLHNDVDLVAFILTDPSHVSFATYSTTGSCPSDSRAPTSETSRSQTPVAALNPYRDSGGEGIDHDGDDDDDDDESDAPPPTPTELCTTS
jgi:hypothetical protein